MCAQKKDYRKWIEAGFKNYGKDPWFFIRELAQNSRDAGARNIRVKVGITAKGEEALVFEDDGRGMSYEDAKKYLFRLYASSKTTDKTSAGMFGIGFWTVLKFNPKQVLIESYYGRGGEKNNWSVTVTVDQELKTSKSPGKLKSRGTRITLIRTAQAQSEQLFLQATRDALIRYCCYLRRNNRSADPLPIYIGGENITREMTLPGPVSLRFKRGPVEGAVGLAPRPQVRLYARGLPVWEGTNLEELSHIPPEYNQQDNFGQGLAPVYLLNGNHLEVNISRRKVIDNRHLQQVRKVAEKALAQMVENAAEHVSPRGFSRKISDKLRSFSKSGFVSFLKVLFWLLLLLIPIEIFLLKTFVKPMPQVNSLQSYPHTISLSADSDYYTGASVSHNDILAVSSGFLYTPPRDRWFRLFYADRFGKASGFRLSSRLDQTLPTKLPKFDCRTQKLTVSLKIDQKGPIFLPHPLNYALDITSITVDAKSVPMSALGFKRSGEIVLSLIRPGLVRYRCCPIKPESTQSLSQAKRIQFTALPPELGFPPEIENKLTRMLDKDVEQKVDTAVAMTSDLLKYDDSLETAKQYLSFPGNRNWFQKVVQIGVGDCDIINGVTAIFLRKMGVPARLVIGAVGRKGEILTVLHAWIEYYDFSGTQHLIDASAHTPRLRPGRNHRAGNRMNGNNDGQRQHDGDKESQLLTQRSILYILSSVSLVLLLILVTVFFFRLPGKAEMPAPEMMRQVERDLAGMALHALLHPNQGVWGQGSGIRDYKLIPTLNNKPVSITEALKLGELQKLYTATADNTIFSYLESVSRSISVPILDSGNSAFEPLIKLFPGALHLEQVTELGVISPEKATNAWIGQLAAAVNDLMKKTGNNDMPRCLLVSGHMSGDLIDVDLSPLPKLPNWMMPNRFIAINSYSRRINALAALFQENKALAQFRLLDLLLKESRLVPVPAVGVLRSVAQKLLIEHIEVAAT
jgi:Histidine kinase-, DNA gyrase B-, and HSP90-like ATPase/Transglutaminase-like superfamily